MTSERLHEGEYTNPLGAVLDVQGPAIRFGLNTLSDDIWVAYSAATRENYIVTAYSMALAGYLPSSASTDRS